jgi:glycosyltransferase involved in cell wall biosynthesis
MWSVTRMRALVYNPTYNAERDPTSLRTTKLMSYLDLRGWQCDVVASPVFDLADGAIQRELTQLHTKVPHLQVFVTHPGFIGSLRYRLHRDAPSEKLGAGNPLEIGGCRSFRQRIYRIMRHWHGRYSQLFARIGDPDWIAPAVLQGARLLRAHDYQVVFASASSCFGSHIAAAIVSTIGRIPLVVDYVDPWGPELPDRPKRLDRISEAFVLRRARRAIVTNGRARDVLLVHHPFLSPARVAVITQGYQQWSGPQQPPTNNGGSFAIGYTGTVYPGVQSASQFFEALRAANSRGVTVRFVRAGPPFSSQENNRIEGLGACSFIEDRGHLPNEGALALQREASVLLVIGTRSRHQIPGKVIEYIGARRPVLCLSTGEGDLAAEFVKEHGLGIVVPNDAQSILEALMRLHRLWRMGKLETIYRPKDVERFSWQCLAGRLEEIFREAMAGDLPASGVPARPGDGRGPDGRPEATRLGVPGR